MKKLFFISLLFVGALSLNAQTKFGVKAGPQITTWTGDDAEGIDAKIGFHVGGYANIRFSEQFAFQPELLFSLQGAQAEELGVEMKFNTSYINVPLMVKWYAYQGLNFEFGPQVGFNVGAKVKGENEIGEAELDFDEAFGQDAETIDFGLNIGAGYELPMGLNFGVRYGLGLTEVIKDVDVKNSVISLGVGYSF